MPNLAPLSYQSKHDCRALASSIRFLASKPVTIDLAAAIYDAGLMRINFFMRLPMVVHQWRFGTTLHAWRYLEQRARGTCEEFVLGTAKWCEDGQDLSDSLSAGGFNRKEFERLIEIVDSMS